MSSQSPVYAVGDLQGCYESLLAILDKIPETATVYFLGDLVNRGPESLKTLRAVIAMGDRARCVLGNHDLHLLAVAANVTKAHRKDTIQEILRAPDAPALIDWLRKQPLMHEFGDTIFVHAGIHPQWTLDQARELARQAHETLSGDDWKAQLSQMYGALDWDENLTGPLRIQAILNGFTRMRFVNKTTGALDFTLKEGLDSAPDTMVPWFDYPHRRLEKNKTVCIGHWSMLGLINRPDLIAIDTGCLWGGELTAVKLPERRFIRVSCPCWADPLAFKKKA